jgi:hypothetical protein
MKTSHPKKSLTFGELIEAVYRACGKRKAGKVVRFAVNARLVVFHSHQLYMISQ